MIKSLTHILVALVVVSILIGCGGGDATVTPGPTDTPQPTSTPNVRQARPGVYTTNEVGALPLPVPGYDVYVIGETHGDRQAKIVLFEYLERLHETLGLRDVILEEDQAYEGEANAYGLGVDENLRVDLCLRTDVLAGVRALNEQLTDDAKIRVHLVDVDSPLPAIYAHLQALREQIGGAADQIQIPPLDEFEGWRKGDALELVDRLVEAAGDRGSVVNGLETVRSSLDYYYAGNRVGIGPPVGSPKNALFREGAITRNIQHLLEELDGAPALIFVGGSHAQKFQGVRTSIPELQDFKTCTQRLKESGVNVYSVIVWGLTGESYWRGSKGNADWGAGRIQLTDGTTFGTLLDAAPEHDILYVDLRIDENASTRLGGGFVEGIPAGEIYDGVILFREFTPMEDKCP